MPIEKAILIIPTYNEAAVIEQTIEAVFSVADRLQHHQLDILIFDSHSTDATQAIVQRLQSHYPERLHLKTEPQKSGLGSAYRQAMHHALHALHADVVIEFDADLSHQPKYLIPMLDAIQHHDVVIGSRYVPGGAIPSNWGIHRKCLSILGNHMARFILTRRYKDFTSGFRATRRHVLINCLPDKFLSNHYAYKLHLLWLLHQHRAQLFEIPIVFVDRVHGKSKLPSNSILDSLRVILILRWREILKIFKMS